MRRLAGVLVVAGVASGALAVGVLAGGGTSLAGTSARKATDVAVVPPNLAYARIRSDGTLDTSRARGITQSMIRFRANHGLFCFYLPFRPLAVMAVAGEEGRLGATAQASIATNHPDCPGSETAHVRVEQRAFFGRRPPYFVGANWGEGAVYVVFVRAPDRRSGIGKRPYVYARVLPSGEVDTARSLGVSNSMITLRPGRIGSPPVPWTYCFYFPFAPRFVFITPDHPHSTNPRNRPVIAQYRTTTGNSRCPGNESGSLVFYDYGLQNNRANVDVRKIQRTIETWPYGFTVFALTDDVPGYASGTVRSDGALLSGFGVSKRDVYKPVTRLGGVYCIDAPFVVRSTLAMHPGQDDRQGRWEVAAHVGTVRGRWIGVTADVGTCSGSDHTQIVLGSAVNRLNAGVPAPITGFVDEGYWSNAGGTPKNAWFSFLLIP